MAKRKETKQEREDFDALYQYVKTKIMNYDENQVLSPDMVLKLKGLKDGNMYHTTFHTNKANYPYRVILMTFQACSVKIKNLFAVMDFNDESHKFNTALKIVRENLNDIYIRSQQAMKSQKKTDQWEIQQGSNASYIPKTKNSDNSSNDQYW